MKCALALVVAGLAFAGGPVAAQTADSTGRVTGPGVINAPAETAVPGWERQTGPGVINAPPERRGSTLSSEEQRAQRARSGSFQSYAECALHRDQQRSEMAARAAARGTPAPAAPQRDACAGLPR